jgi:hypothetical protein
MLLVYLQMNLIQDVRITRSAVLLNYNNVVAVYKFKMYMADNICSYIIQMSARGGKMLLIRFFNRFVATAARRKLFSVLIYKDLFLSRKRSFGRSAADYVVTPAISFKNDIFSPIMFTYGYYCCCCRILHLVETDPRIGAAGRHVPMLQH